MKRKNMISMVTSLALVGVVAVGGTLALLTSQTESLQNTFAVGNGYDQDGEPDFILQENEVTQAPDGSYIKKTDPAEVLTPNGQDYSNLVSDTTLFKNPFFTLRNGGGDDTNPPESWVVAKIDYNDVQDMKAANITFSAESVSTDWYLVKATKSDATWTYDASTAVTAQVLNNLKADTENEKYYFVYKNVLEVDDKTDPLFTELSVGTVTAKTEATNLDVFGVAVQYVEGAALESNLDQIVGAAAGTLDKAVAASRPSQP